MSGGAPKGNTNALKHGLYAKHYTPEQRKDLKHMSPEDLTHEINLLRSIAADLYAVHIMLKAFGSQLDIDKYDSNANSIVNAADKVGSLAVRLSTLSGTNASINDEFYAALDELPAYDPYDDTDPR